MNISNFDELLQAARAQAQPQRLLFVFAAAELPDDNTPEQAARFAAGEGGALVPLMVVDKDVAELPDFDTLARESLQFNQDWCIVFAAALPGSNSRAPSSSDAERPLQRMVEAIRQGTHAAFMPFDRHGQTVLFQ